MILKWWSLSLPAFLMDVIIFLAGLGAAQVLWGPCPRNDSAIIKEHNTGPESSRKSKLCENTANAAHEPKMETLTSSATIRTQGRHERLVSITTESHWIVRWQGAVLCFLFEDYFLLYWTVTVRRGVWHATKFACWNLNQQWLRPCRMCCNHSDTKALQGAALLTWGSSTEVLNSRCYLSLLQPLLWLVSYTCEFTTQCCLNCLTVLAGKVAFLYPGTMWVTVIMMSGKFSLLDFDYWACHRLHFICVQRDQPSI